MSDAGVSRGRVLELMDGSIQSAAVAAALELGLFWIFEDGPLDAAAVGSRVGIPTGTCEAWLLVLAEAGLIEATPSGYRLTGEASASIVGTYSRESWRMLAIEARERLDSVTDLPARLRGAKQAGEGMDDYVQAMAADPDRARRFTMMLYELHSELAAQVAEALNIGGARRLLDLGGGSGVVAMALARRWPDLSVVVLDVGPVCAVGEGLAASAGLADRVAFRGGDFLTDDLPTGFDVVLECDVGIYSERLFARIRDCLVPGGRFALIDELPGPGEMGSPQWALIRTLSDPGWEAPSVASVSELLGRTGFDRLTERRLPTAPGIGGREAGPILIEAWRTV